MPVVDDAAVKLPWSTKKEVENGQRDNIALQSVFICSNFEGDSDRMLNLYSDGIA